MRSAQRKKEAKFIFAKLKTSLRHHDKLMAAIVKAGWGVLGVYAWATMDLREKESRDGVISDAVIRVGMPNQPDTEALIAALVDVGLFVRREGGYYVDKYEVHNDTKDVIDRNRAGARTRMRIVRANITRTSTEHDANIDRTKGVCSPVVPISNSISNSNSSLSLPDPESSSFRLTGSSQPAKARTRTQHRHPETMIPASDASAEEIAVFCAKWKLPPPESEEVQQFLNVHRRKESVYRDWSACWATFKRMGEQFAASNGRGRIVQGQVGKPEWMKDGDF